MTTYSYPIDENPKQNPSQRSRLHSFSFAVGHWDSPDSCIGEDDDNVQLDLNSSTRSPDWNEFDKRPHISDLLQTHSTAINVVRSIIREHPLYDKSRYDDIWILRFVLSKKNTNKAILAAIATMKFRHEKGLNNIGDIRSRLPNHKDVKHLLPGQKKLLSLCDDKAFVYAQPDVDRGILSYTTLSKLNMPSLGKYISKEDLEEVYIYRSEAVYQNLDEITRRTGRLTKEARLMVLGGISMTRIDMTFAKRDAAVSKSMQDFYPQMVGAVYIVDPPRWVNFMWRIMKPLLPKSMVEKFDFIFPCKVEKDLRKLFPFISIEKLPKVFGGRHEVWPPLEIRQTPNNAFL